MKIKYKIAKRKDEMFARLLVKASISRDEKECLCPDFHGIVKTQIEAINNSDYIYQLIGYGHEMISKRINDKDFDWGRLNDMIMMYTSPIEFNVTSVVYGSEWGTWEIICSKENYKAVRKGVKALVDKINKQYMEAILSEEFYEEKEFGLDSRVEEELSILMFKFMFKQSGNSKEGMIW